MRTQQSLGLERPIGPLLRRMGIFLREAILLAAFLTLIESTGAYAIHDGADVMALAGVALLLTLWARGGRSGWLPMTGAALEKSGRGARTLLGKLAPGYAVAFRRNDEVTSKVDTVLLPPIAVIGSLTILVLACGPWLLPAATFIKFHVSYTLYLAIMAFVWALHGLVLQRGFVVAGSWIGRVGPRRQLAPALVLGLGWGISTALLARAPGIVSMGLLLLLAGRHWRTLSNPMARRYVLCRRDAAGAPLVVPVHTILLRAYGLVIVLLALATAFASGPRLWSSQFPSQPYSFTGWLGLSATVAALVLVLQLEAHLRLLSGTPRQSPDLPLSPTLWVRAPEDTPRPAWVQNARDMGWWVSQGTRPPDTGFDLVAGVPDHARRFEPTADMDDETFRFQLSRRLHVVMRRRFHRRLQGLMKQLSRHKNEPGGGFLFCPHAWLAPGVVRDAEPRRTARGLVMVPTFYGSPYATLFDVRLRRYLGGVLRELRIDMIFWEDAITWKDVRRVTGVLFESYDQGRTPLHARDFVGIPRVRVLIDEEPAELAPRESIPGQPAAPGHTRVLLITRDRGKGEESPTDVPRGTSRLTPVLS